MQDNPDVTVQLTLPRKQWHLIVWLAGRGALQVFDHYVRNKAHEIDCVTEAADAIKALEKAYKEQDPEAPEDTLPSMPPPVLPN